jgi:hypothetical protein
MTLSARRRWRPALLFVAALAAAILAGPRPAVAWVTAELFCPEIFNPHGQTTPPAGWSTAPGTTSHSTPVNPDGFFQVGACSPVEALDCPTGLGGPEFAGLCTCEGGTTGAVNLYDRCGGGDTANGIPFFYGTFDFGTIIKYTEANGKPAAQKEMAGNNSPNGGGQAISVDWHLWGQGDLLVCDAENPTVCICCRVPNPPFSDEPIP